MQDQDQYNEDNIRSLDWKEHIRLRPGMYIGKLGDGSSPDDGIYILLKEVLDNCIDEFVMGAGKTIEVTMKEKLVTVRDYGRGIPLGKVVDAQKLLLSKYRINNNLQWRKILFRQWTKRFIRRNHCRRRYGLPNNSPTW